MLFAFDLFRGFAGRQCFCLMYLNPTRLHLLGNLTDEIDFEQAVGEVGAGDRYEVGELERRSKLRAAIPR